MKVFVAGATGVLGARAVALLVEAGHTVTAIARSAEKAELVRSLGATPVRVSLFDRDELSAAVTGHDAVVNLATHIPSLTAGARPSAWRENDRIRTEGATNLVDAALAAGALRYVQESITFTYPDSGDAWIDAETTPIEPTAALAAVAAAEGAASRFEDSVVLRFALLYAPDSSHIQTMVGAGRKGVGLVAGRPGAYQSMVHADDAAAAVVAALDAPPGTYDIVDDEPLTKRQVAAAFGAKLRLPGSMARFGGDSAAALTRSQRVSNRRFKEATGWRPSYPGLRDGLPDVVAAIGERPHRPLTEALVRPVLVALAASALTFGVWISVSPRSFYDDFPGLGRAWVSVDGPFNEHLLRDFGQGQLALAALLLAAAIRPERYLVRIAALASLLFAVPHLAYHATHLDVYETSDKVGNIVALGLAVALPALLVLGTTGRAAERRGRARTGRPDRCGAASGPPPALGSRPARRVERSGVRPD